MNKEKKSESNIPKNSKGGQLLDLYHACQKNAVNLLDEAEILFEHNKYSRAFFLAFTALEEIGKSQIVADYLAHSVSEENFQDAFRKHDVKFAYLYIALLDPKKGSKEVDLGDEPPEVKEYMILRNKSLYVTFTTKNTILVPENSINKDLASELISEVNNVFSKILNAEWLNGIIGSKGLLK